MEAHRITNAGAISRFITGGKAYFTLRSTKTGNRFTYRAKASQDGNVHFVGVMNGSDNTNSYAYLGIIKNGKLASTAKAKVPATDPRFKAIEWSYRKVTEGQVPDELEFWHEGRCACCGRRLTVPESIEAGIGPECIKRFSS
jgi:hypothetical protein